MRTTLDLPDDLVKQAKIAAVLRGTTLRDLVAKGIRRELDSERIADDRVDSQGERRQSASPLRITPEILKQIELEDDLERGGMYEPCDI